jgi:glutathione reductase (NADPH)
VKVGGRRIEARKILIATGSMPRTLSLPGAAHMITSDEILDLKTQPGEMVFVGAGVISLEFSHVLARAGVKVTILELMDRPLPAMDQGAVAQIEKATRDLGIDLVTGAKVRAIEKSNRGFAVHYESGAEKRTASADVVANGAGRVPAIESLDLDAAGVAWDRKTGIQVNEFLRSVTNPDVFVAGDALAGPPQLSPVASYQGKLAGNNIIGREPAAPDYRTIPSCVYTVPALAQVGRTEEQAQREGLEFRVKVSDMVSWRSARTYAEHVAYAKILIEKTTDRILGAHLVGHGAPEVVHTFAFAMKHGVTAKDIKSTVFAYPTFTSDIQYLV